MLVDCELVVSINSLLLLFQIEIDQSLIYIVWVVNLPVLEIISKKMKKSMYFPVYGDLIIQAATES